MKYAGVCVGSMHAGTLSKHLHDPSASYIKQIIALSLEKTQQLHLYFKSDKLGRSRPLADTMLFRVASNVVQL